MKKYVNAACVRVSNTDTHTQHETRTNACVCTPLRSVQPTSSRQSTPSRGANVTASSRIRPIACTGLGHVILRPATELATLRTPGQSENYNHAYAYRRLVVSVRTWRGQSAQYAAGLCCVRLLL